MSWVDNNASNAHQHLLVSPRESMETALIIDWTRFLMSLLHRSPDRIAYLNTKIATYSREDQESFTEDVYNQHREPSDPATFDEWLNLRGDLRPAISLVGCIFRCTILLQAQGLLVDSDYCTCESMVHVNMHPTNSR